MLRAITAHLRPPDGPRGDFTPAPTPAAAAPPNVDRGEIPVRIAHGDHLLQVAAHPDEPLGYLKARACASNTALPGPGQLQFSSSLNEELTLAEHGIADGAELRLEDRPAAVEQPPRPPPAGCVEPPLVVSTAAEARAAVVRHGVCIWRLAPEETTELRTTVATLASRMFGEHLAMAKAPVLVDDPSRIVKPHNDGASP